MTQIDVVAVTQEWNDFLTLVIRKLPAPSSKNYNIFNQKGLKQKCVFNSRLITTWRKYDTFEQSLSLLQFRHIILQGKKKYRIFTFHFFFFESAGSQLWIIPNLHIREKLKFVILDILPNNVTLPNIMQVSPKVMPPTDSHRNENSSEEHNNTVW